METKSLAESLKGRFTLVSLGCIGDSNYPLPPDITRALTVVEVDAEGGANTGNPFFRKVTIDKPISDKRGRHTFIRNSFAGTCSLLRPSDRLVKAYGMEAYCDMKEMIEVDCETIPDVLIREGIQSLDFLKTDVEGLDAAIIRSCEGFLGRTLFIQCELRFEPFYHDEPPFHEVVAYLAGFGYEVLDVLHIDRWKYKTRNQKRQLQGRAVWGDFLFSLKADRIASVPGDEMPLSIAKQIILACMLGKKNYGEHLLERFQADLPEEWKSELRRLVKPGLPTFWQMRNSLGHFLMPLQLFLKHRINKSTHVSIRLGR